MLRKVPSNVPSYMAYKEQELEPVEDGVDAQHWLPVLPQDVEANVAVQVDVGVIHLEGGISIDVGA